MELRAPTEGQQFLDVRILPTFKRPKALFREVSAVRQGPQPLLREVFAVRQGLQPLYREIFAVRQGPQPLFRGILPQSK